MKYLFIGGLIIGAGIIFFNSKWWKRQLQYIALGSQIRINGKRIQEAKKQLEILISNKDYVSSISTQKFVDSCDVVNEGTESYIQIGIISENHIEDVRNILDQDRWMGFCVKIIIQPI